MKVHFSIFLAGLLALTGCTSDKQGGAPNSTTNTTTGNTTNTPPQDSVQRIRLSFVGDIMGHGDQIKSAFDPKTEQYNYEPCFRYIRPVLEESHLAFGNLELTLNNRGKYSGYPRFRSPDTLAHFIKNAGFDYIVTANNHSNDDDLEGVVHTLDVLDGLNMPHTGTFRDTAEKLKHYPHLFEHKVGNTVFRFAILNYTYGTNGIPTEAPAIVNLIDTALILKDIEKAKTLNPDMVIALMHWGSEYQLNERTEQQRITQLLWRNGVDLVIGAHPHVIQPIKTDTLPGALQGGERPVLVAYSLGNFISNQFQKNTDIGLIVEVELEKNNRTGKTRIADHNYILAWRYIHKKGSPVHDRTHTILPVAAFEADSSNYLGLPSSAVNEMKAVSERMRLHLDKWGGKERKVAVDWAKLGKLD